MKLKGVNQWLPGCRLRDFTNSKGEGVKNRPLITYLDSLLQERAELGQQVVLTTRQSAGSANDDGTIQVKMEYVKGHSGTEGNDGADEMANLGVLKPDILEEPDWAAKEAEVRSRIRLLKSNATRRDIRIAGSSRRASIVEALQSTSATTSARSSREILNSTSANSCVPDVPSPSSSSRAGRFKPYNPPPQMGNTSSIRASARRSPT